MCIQFALLSVCFQPRAMLLDRRAFFAGAAVSLPVLAAPLPTMAANEEMSPAKAKIEAAKAATAAKTQGFQASDDKAEQLRRQNESDMAMKKARAQVVMQRQSDAEAIKQRERERMAASGVPPCPTSVWGEGQSGLLQATACSRVRDGTITRRQSTGAFLIF